MPLSYESYLKEHTMEKASLEHDLFRQWAIEQDIKINGIVPAKVPGRGLGVVAERKIEADEELIFVPASALLSTDSIVEEVKDAALAEGISVHGLLAMYLAITAQQDEDPYAEWRRVWPSRADLISSMPVQWPYALRGLRKSVELGTWSPLPPSINGEWSKDAVADLRHGGLATSSSRLEKQRRKIDKDWTRAKKLCEGQLEYNDYVYHWLIVNTRSFYFDGMEDKFESRDDNMALCPFVDYFNHSDKGCRVQFNDEGYSVVADRSYGEGEELFVSYGDHDNDLLLTDYGFILDNNKADAVPLDDIVLFGPSGVYKWKNLLNEHNYFGDYTIGSDGGVCYRTQIAAAIRILPENEWEKLVAGQRDLSSGEKQQIHSVVKGKWLAVWLREAQRALDAWESVPMRESKEVPKYIKDVATKRWKQIVAILDKALKRDEA